MILENSVINKSVLRMAFTDADLGVVCVKGEGLIKPDDNLCHRLSFNDGFECMVYDVFYNSTDGTQKKNIDVTRHRYEAVHMIYGRWLLYKEHKQCTKSPFGNREFMSYITSCGVTDADYVLISV